MFHIKSKENEKNRIEKTLHFGYPVICLLWIYLIADFMATLMDYYILGVEMPFWDFYSTYSGGRAQICIAIIFLFCVLLFVAFQNLYVAIIPGLILFYGFAIADRIMYSIRNEVLNYKDLSLTEAAHTAADFFNIDTSGNFFSITFFVIVIIIVSIVFELCVRKYKKKTIKNKCIRNIIKTSLATGIIILLCWICMSQNASTNDISAMPTAEEASRYALYRFFEKDGTGFGDDSILESYNRIIDYELNNSKENSKKKPHVICIMAESWWNTDRALWDDYVDLSRDPMEAFHLLEGECVTGFVSANICGGGTCTSEYDFLTGVNSKYSSSTSTVFNNIIGKENPLSIVEYFNDMDYTTIGMHPYYNTFYSREEAWNALGFDKTIFSDKMDYTEEYDKYISDDALMDQIIKEYEKCGADEKLFVWAVTVAAHSPAMEWINDYNENYEYSINVSVDYDEAINDKEMRDFIHGINAIYDEGYAFKKIKDYFSKIDEPVVLMMFGDHLPAWSNAICHMIGKVDYSKNDVNELYRFYTTPVIMWKNYDDYGSDEITIDGQQISALSTLLAEYAGLPDCDMFYLHRFFNSKFKADSRFYTIDIDNNILKNFTEEQKTILMDYKKIWFDQMKGKGILTDIWSPKSLE